MGHPIRRRRWSLALGAGLVAGLGAFFFYRRPLTPLGAFFGWWLLTRPGLAVLVGGAVAGLLLFLTRHSSGGRHGEP
jgi:hypothetical protein